MEVKLVWATPDIDGILAYIARVSNPDGQDKPVGKLFTYMMNEGHSSPFQMANVCVEVNTTRDIGRQMLRHWTMLPQEFSQRYQVVNKLGDFEIREFRLAHPTNRQASIEVPADDPLAVEWTERQQRVIDMVKENYEWCLANGGAKEVARVILPEGNTPSRLYFNAPMRTWIFYLKQRLHESTQKEHRLVAEALMRVLREAAPLTIDAFFPTN